MSPHHLFQLQPPLFLWAQVAPRSHVLMEHAWLAGHTARQEDREAVGYLTLLGELICDIGLQDCCETTRSVVGPSRSRAL
jgi:hypothetical protein